MFCGLVRLGQDSREDRHRCGAREGGRGCRNGMNFLEDEWRYFQVLDLSRGSTLFLQ